MKKILAIGIVLMMIGITIPAIANQNNRGWYNYYDGPNPITVDTYVTVPDPSYNGNPPIIKCVWENDQDPTTDGIQIFPVLDGTQHVDFWAIVTDPEGVDTVANVYVDLYNPDGTLKYELELTIYPKWTDGGTGKTGVQEWLDAWANDDIVTWNDVHYAGMTRGEVFSEIYHELNESTARIYHVVGELTYCQIAGTYMASYIAYDVKDNPSDRLESNLCYVPTAGIEIDFNSVDYGTVDLHYWKIVSGDFDMGTPLKPTVRGIGNTDFTLKIRQDDMGLGMTGGQYNVRYKARLDEGTYVEYDPYDEVYLNDYVERCNIEKLDFGILVDKPGSGSGTYDGTMVITPIVFGDYGCCMPTESQP